jgi:hypothetical protein
MTRIVWFRRITLAALITLAFGPLAAGQTGISVNFTATGGPNPGAALLSTETAGFVPLTNWNNVDASNITTTNLIKNTGATTGAQMVVSGSANSWSIPAANLPNPPTPDAKMMTGYLDTTNTSTTTVTISGLNAAGFTGTYHVYVYAVGDANSGRNGDYTATTGPATTQTYRLLDDQQFNGTFRLVNQAPTTGQAGQSGNYMDFSVNGLDSVTITAIATQDTGVNGVRAPINGIQIVMPVPEPGAVLSAAVLGLGAIAAARRRFGRPPA